MPEKNLDFAKRLNTLLKQKGITAYRLAKIISIDPSSMTGYLKGRVPEAAILLKISMSLDVTAQWLQTGADPTWAQEMRLNWQAFQDSLFKLEGSISKGKVPVDQVERIEGLVKIYKEELDFILQATGQTPPPGSLKPLPKVYPESRDEEAKVAEPSALFYAEDILDKQLAHLLSLLEYVYTQSADFPLRRQEIEAMLMMKLTDIKRDRDDKKRGK